MAKAVQWQKENRAAHLERRRSRTQLRINQDPCHKLAVRLRQRLYVAIKKGNKTGSAVADLGCSVKDLKSYLESRFYSRSTTGEQMSWENWSRRGWQIDHIEPIRKLKEGKTVAELCHYSNLQPLWYEDNLAKRNQDLGWGLAQ